MKTCPRIAIACTIAFAPTITVASETTTAKLTAAVAPGCTFTTAENTVGPVSQIGNTPGTYNIGNLGYTCNFTGPTGKLSIASEGGTFLVNENDPSHPVLYTVKWGDLPSVSLTGFVASTEFAAANPANKLVAAPVKITFTNPLTVAGFYRDTITFTLEP
jgi:hypothetical protein